jgi:hypothetical protein
MKVFTWALLTATTAAICACSVLMPAPVHPGETEARLIADRGQPTHRYADGNDRLLEYAEGPWGQRTYMARIGPDGKVISFQQVLTSERFATIKIGQSTKHDVLLTVGAPVDTSYLPLSGLEVWSYPFKQNDVWNSIMHIHFDQNGIVRKMLVGPDPRYDPDWRLPFGMLMR